MECNAVRNSSESEILRPFTSKLVYYQPDDSLSFNYVVDGPVYTSHFILSNVVEWTVQSSPPALTDISSFSFANPEPLNKVKLNFYSILKIYI